MPTERQTFYSFIAPFRKHALLPHDEIADLIRAVQAAPPETLAAGTCHAMNRLLRHNIDLLMKLAEKYADKAEMCGMTFGDIFSHCGIGLQDAVLKFKFSKKAKLSTYLPYRVRCAVARAMENAAGIFRTPNHVQDKRRAVLRFRDRHWSECGELPNDDETARETGVDIAWVRRICGQAPPHAYLSFDTPRDISEDGTSVTLYNLLTDENAPSPEEMSVANERRERLRLLRSSPLLDDRHRLILRCRYERDMTLHETVDEVRANGFDIGYESIRQLEREAIRQLAVGFGLREPDNTPRRARRGLPPP